MAKIDFISVQANLLASQKPCQWAAPQVSFAVGQKWQNRELSISAKVTHAKKWQFGNLAKVVVL